MTGDRIVRTLAAWMAPLMLLPPVLLGGEGPVALQTADPSCRDTSGSRYVDCGNGTVTDNVTGLVWLKFAACGGGTIDFHLAHESVAGLSDLPADFPEPDADCGLSDHSSPGEWRLPSASEWQAMVAAAAAMDCSPAITNDAGTGCWDADDPGSSFRSVLSTGYWSATPEVIMWSEAYVMFLDFNGTSSSEPKSDLYRAWPVRGGQ